MMMIVTNVMDVVVGFVMIGCDDFYQCNNDNCCNSNGIAKYCDSCSWCQGRVSECSHSKWYCKECILN